MRGREKREGRGKGGVRGEKRRRERGRERVYGIVIIIRNIIEHNREWINKCVLDKPW